MATFQVKRCPHCGKIYERNSYAGHPSKDNRTKYGSPLKYCSSCKCSFLDTEYREIAIDGPRKADTMLVSPAGIVFGLLLLIFGVVVFRTSSIGGCLVIAIGLYFPVSEMLSYEKRLDKLQIEAANSKKRLENPTYAAALKRLGYNVPQEYLSPISQNTAGPTSADAWVCNGCGTENSNNYSMCKKCGKYRSS